MIPYDSPMNDAVFSFAQPLHDLPLYITLRTQSSGVDDPRATWRALPSCRAV